MPALKNPRHERFCRAYVAGETAGNGAASYKAAGYDCSSKAAGVAASRLLTDANIIARLQELQGAVANIEQKATERAIERLAVTKESVFAELAKLGFANMLDYVQPTAEGDVTVDLSALNRDQAAAIQEVVVDSYQDGRGEDARQVKRVRFKLADKRAALVDLGKHLGMFVERRHVTTEHVDKPTDELSDRLSAIVAQLQSLGIDFGALVGGGTDRGRTGTPETSH